MCIRDSCLYLMIFVKYLHITFYRNLSQLLKRFVKNVGDVGASLVETMTSICLIYLVRGLSENIALGLQQPRKLGRYFDRGQYI